MRAVSTVVDVTLCLLFVSAATLVLVTAPAEPPAADRPGDETAAQLASTTATVEYELDTDEGGPDDLGWDGERVRHGSIAGLLARAALANATLDGTPLSPDSRNYRDAVAVEAAAILPPRTAVMATWRPYPDAPLDGAVAVGERSPPDTDTAVTTLRVPVPDWGESPPSDPDGFDELAEGLARPIVATAVPADRPATTRDATVHDAIDHRATTLADDGGVSMTVAAHLNRSDTANAAVVDALADRLSADLAFRYETPGCAAEEMTPGTVWLVIERWEP